MKQRFALGLAALLLLAWVVGAEAQGVDALAVAGSVDALNGWALDSVQCSDLGTEWTATWRPGEFAHSDAFSLIVYDGRLTVQGLPCGKSVWKIAKVCISAPGQVLWVMWSDPMQDRLVWGLPYAPAQVAVLGECRFEMDGARPPIAWPNMPQRGGMRPPVMLPEMPSQYR